MAAEPKIIHLSADGATGTGLTPLQLDPADFQSSLPKQNAHVAFSDDTAGLNVGVWDTTDMQEAFGPYPGDEFILVLDGAFSMLDADNNGVTAGQGDLVAFRNGAPLSWLQKGYLKKFFLTLQPPDTDPPALPTAEGGVIVIDPATNLTDADILSEEDSTGSGAVEREIVFFTNDSATMSVGLWDCQAFDAEDMSPFPCHELVVMAEGEVTIREPGGISQSFGPGDVFFVPAGAVCSWHVPRYIRKFFAAVDL
ncbi:MAG: cupin domain-containing protein [Pseudomonadota bacterium]